MHAGAILLWDYRTVQLYEVLIKEYTEWTISLAKKLDNFIADFQSHIYCL